MVNRVESTYPRELVGDYVAGLDKGNSLPLLLDQWPDKGFQRILARNAGKQGLLDHQRELLVHIE
jgi:hypothetical protein